MATDDSRKKLAELIADDPGALEKAIQRLVEHRVDKALALTPEERVEKLRGLVASFNCIHSFQAGDVVRWKRGLKNKKRPAYGEPAIVIKVVDPPLFDEVDPGSAYFREPLDIVVGLLEGDDELVTFHYNSRLFEPYK